MFDAERSSQRMHQVPEFRCAHVLQNAAMPLHERASEGGAGVDEGVHVSVPQLVTSLVAVPNVQCQRGIVPLMQPARKLDNTEP